MPCSSFQRLMDFTFRLLAPYFHYLLLISLSPIPPDNSAGRSRSAFLSLALLESLLCFFLLCFNARPELCAFLVSASLSQAGKNDNSARRSLIGAVKANHHS